VLLVSLTQAQNAQTASGETESLKQALVAAMATSPELAGESALVKEISASRLSVAHSHWLPSLQATGDTGVKKEQQLFQYSLFPIQEGRVKPVDLVATLDQPIFRGGQTLAETRAARAAVSAEQARQSGIEQQVLERAAKRYLEVVTNEEIVRLRFADVEDLRQIEESVRLQVESGQLTRTDILQAQSRLAASNLDLTSATAKLETARAQYEETMGHPPGRLRRPTSILELPQTVTAALSAALTDNPGVRAADYDRQEAVQKVRGTRGQLLPTVDLKISYRKTKFDYFIPQIVVSAFQTTDTSAMLFVTVPLYQPGELSQLSAARFAVRQATAKAEQAGHEITTTVKTAWLARDAAREKVRGYSQVARVAREVLEGVRAEQLAGGRTVLDVLNAQRDVFSADLSLVSARNDADEAQIDLAVAVGALTAEEMGLATVR
jgi:TolC family type I secretion outer membrane protein